MLENGDAADEVQEGEARRAPQGGVGLTATSQKKPLSGRGLFWRASGVAALVALASAAIHAGVPLCPTAAFFGIPCPGCGLTRATLLLAQGQLGAALRVHPLVPLLAPLYFGALGGAAVSFVLGPERRGALRLPKGFWTQTWLSRVGGALLVVTLGVWLGRFFGACGGPVPVKTLWPSHASGLKSSAELGS
ncbi:MAG TPA: DUF2752 domain-containing protein, partial [Armatimonadota bacterium]|nr:DUF2752 domain-containing protein [Armatimonadota bacterium]